MAILLTGCTGFVGKFVLHELLAKDTQGPIMVLLREKRGATALDR